MNRELLEGLLVWLDAGAPEQTLENGLVAHGFDMAYVQRKVGTVRELRDWIAPPTPESCGSVCCIAGYLMLLNGRETFSTEEYEAETSKLLGIDFDDAIRLTSPWSYYEATRKDAPHYTRCMDDIIDPAWAARTIRHLLKTGRVDWIDTAPEEYTVEERYE